MSDAMLHGVLQMPPDLWDNDSCIDVGQRHGRYTEVSYRITADGKTIEVLMTVLDAAKNLRDANGGPHSERVYRNLMAAVVEADLQLSQG